MRTQARHWLERRVIFRANQIACNNIPACLWSLSSYFVVQGNVKKRRADCQAQNFSNQWNHCKVVRERYLKVIAEKLSKVIMGTMRCERQRFDR